MSFWGRLVEDKIKRAMEAGQFDNLPGSGEPIAWVDAPFEDPEDRLVFHLLKNSGYSLPWVQERREIELAIKGARASLERSWHWYQAHDDAWTEADWGRAVEGFKNQIERINQRIRNYNLVVPTHQVQRRLLDVDRELRELTKVG